MSAVMVKMSETIVPMSTGMSSTDEYPVLTKSVQITIVSGLYLTL